MLKRYTYEDRIQWVGKAWEIRRALRQTGRQKGEGARLVDLLPRPSGSDGPGANASASASAAAPRSRPRA